jgi:hypothetical protein
MSISSSSSSTGSSSSVNNNNNGYNNHHHLGQQRSSYLLPPPHPHSHHHISSISISGDGESPILPEVHIKNAIFTQDKVTNFTIFFTVFSNSLHIYNFTV